MALLEVECGPGWGIDAPATRISVRTDFVIAGGALNFPSDFWETGWNFYWERCITFAWIYPEASSSTPGASLFNSSACGTPVFSFPSVWLACEEDVVASGLQVGGAAVVFATFGNSRTSFFDGGGTPLGRWRYKALR